MFSESSRWPFYTGSGSFWRRDDGAVRGRRELVVVGGGGPVLLDGGFEVEPSFSRRKRFAVSVVSSAGR